MTDLGTIKIPREDFERHNERRKDLGLSWAEYIDGEAPDALAAALAANIDYAELANRTADELEGRMR